MSYTGQTKALVAEKLHDWKVYLTNYRLPTWEEIPNDGMYMDQLIGFISQYLDYLPPELKDEQFITPATINNYVRTGVMPRPVKKRYYRTHLAYLLIICSLKQTLSIALIQRIIPNGMSDEYVRAVYGNYVEMHGISREYFSEHITELVQPIMGREVTAETTVDCTEDLVLAAALIGGFGTLLAEKLLLLNYEGDSLGITTACQPS